MMIPRPGRIGSYREENDHPKSGLKPGDTIDTFMKFERFDRWEGPTGMLFGYLDEPEMVQERVFFKPYLMKLTDVERHRVEELVSELAGYEVKIKSNLAPYYIGFTPTGKAKRGVPAKLKKTKIRIQFYLEAFDSSTVEYDRDKKYDESFTNKNFDWL